MMKKTTLTFVFTFVVGAVTGALLWALLVDERIDKLANVVSPTGDIRQAVEILEGSEVLAGLDLNDYSITIVDSDGAELTLCCDERACLNKDLPSCDENILEFFRDKEQIFIVRANTEKGGVKPGYGSGALNSLVGTAKADNHLPGCAVDFELPDGEHVQYPDPCTVTKKYEHPSE